MPGEPIGAGVTEGRPRAGWGTSPGNGAAVRAACPRLGPASAPRGPRESVFEQITPKSHTKIIKNMNINFFLINNKKRSLSLTPDPVSSGFPPGLRAPLAAPSQPRALRRCRRRAIGSAWVRSGRGAALGRPGGSRKGQGRAARLGSEGPGSGGGGGGAVAVAPGACEGGAEMADETLFLLLHSEMVAGLYRAAEQGEGVSGDGDRLQGPAGGGRRRGARG